MNCIPHNNEFSLPDASDYLTSLQVKLESAPSGPGLGAGLSDFVRLLIDLTNVLEHHADDPEAGKLSDFIQSGMEEVRATVHAEEPSFGRPVAGCSG